MNDRMRERQRSREMRVAWRCSGFCAFLCFVMRLTSATVVLKSISASFSDLPAKYAAPVGNTAVCGALFVADPLDACSPLRFKNATNGTELETRFALIERGECSFEDKIRSAQNAGFRAAIIYDDRDEEKLLYMMVNPEDIKIHARFVRKHAGEILRKHARGDDVDCCIHDPHTGKSWTVLAIAFISVVVMLGVVVIVFFAPRHWPNWHGSYRCPKSVDSKLVETLPRFTFRPSGSGYSCPGDTCAICLEDYRDGESIKRLPCRHMFHSSCVDSWLTKWGTCCPICKLDMRTRAKSSDVSLRSPRGRQYGKLALELLLLR